MPREGVRSEDLPFEIKYPNAETQRAIEAARAGKTASFASLDEMVDDLNED